jgi:hypothetical protein
VLKYIILKNRSLSIENVLKIQVYFAENYIKIVNVDEGPDTISRMWKFQKEMIKTYHQNRFSITKCPRQVGKTTTSVAYLLWFDHLYRYSKRCVLAKKGASCKRYFCQIPVGAPKFTYRGSATRCWWPWNKGNVRLEKWSKNCCRIYI